MVISIIRKFKRDFKVNGFFDYQTSRKYMRFQERHPGINKVIANINYKLMFKNGGIYRESKKSKKSK